MKFTKLALPLLVALVYAPSHVFATPLLGAELASFSALAGDYLTTGAYSISNGNLGAYSGAITTGANATSFNNYAGAAITYGANATSLSSNAIAAITYGANANGGTSGTNISILGTALTQFDTAKAALTSMGTGITLGATMGGNVTLTPGVYSASALTTAANTVLTLDGGGAANPYWVFNIDTYLVTGATTLVQFASGTTNASVLWNTGGYMTLGANTSLIGTVLATDYISEGAGAGISCGNAFSRSYVTLGDSVTSSASNCAGSSKGMGGGLDIVNGKAVASVSAVPEPESYAMLLAGLGLMAGITRRRRNKNA